MIKVSRGFTLIELMIVVAIIGIISAFAIPAYNKQVMRGKRVDAKAFLLDIASRQERLYTEKISYSSTLSDLGLSAATSPEGHYSVAVSVTPSGCSPSTTKCTYYKLTATGPSNDAECLTLTFDSLGGKGYTGSASSYDQCWR
ncbi:type IV pilin protein [Agaribacterium sp. ZY112]|uniref:type IV pilin protein n=1 Tax=Agaribacterium sp. ZY112 TaxID=3233574 RepID=UPI0035248251